MHKTRLHFSLTYFYWNTSVTGHKREVVGFPQGKQLPRSPEKSSVMALYVDTPLIATQFRYHTAFNGRVSELFWVWW